MQYTVTMFGASWCAPCAVTRPIIETLAAQFENATFEYIDVESGDPRAEGIMSVPVIRYASEDGTIAHEHYGAGTAEQFQNILAIVMNR